jgi:hypothetical protein
MMGPWSDDLSFSVEGNEPPPVPSGQPLAPSGESADGTLVPSAPSITDASGDVWTLGALAPSGTVREVARNGSVFPGVFASQLKYRNHGVYLHGQDGNWYLASGGTWISVGSSEP